MDQIIHAKWIITCATNNQILEDHALVIKDGKIAAILPSSEAKRDYPKLPSQAYPSHALLPGFINSHTHAPMNLFRGLADDLALTDWLNGHIWPAESKWVSQQMVQDGTELAIAEMLRGGTTCFNDMYFYPDAAAVAAKAAGIRAHIGMTVIGVPTAWAKTPAECFAKSEAFYDQFKDDELITPTLAPHSTYTVEMTDLVKVKQMATQYNLKINIHLQEDAAEITQSLSKHQARPLQRLYEHGLVDEQLIAIHMTQVNAADIAILCEKRPNIVHCPESNMKLSAGTCPVHMLSEAGINIALGTDGAASNNDLDMLGEMQSAALLGKLTAGDPKAVPALAALKMATINGAKALGIDQRTGSLEVGKAADCITIDLANLETQPLYHPLSQIIYAASRQQVTAVWVNGKQLLKDRQLLTLDLDAIMAKVNQWQKKLIELA